MFFVILFSFLFVIFFMHYAVYCFLRHAFSVENKKIRIILGFVLFLFSVSFILSAVLAHKWENILTRFFYNFSTTWYGLLINLLLFIFIYWIGILIFKYLKKNINKKIFGKTTIVLGLLFSIYGVYNACSPNIKEVSVKIDSLPEEWRGKRIVQLSDVHLGRSLGSSFLKKVVKKVNSVNAEIVVITGDLFDGMDGYLSSFVDDLNKIKSNKGIYYITGNHETYLGLKEVFATLEKTDFIILKDDVVNVDSLQIIGVSYPDNNGKDIKKIIESDEDFNLDSFSILLYHSPINLYVPKTSNNNWHRNIYWTPDVSFSVARELGVDLQLSGHTHRGQMFPFNFMTKAIFGGYDYGLHQVDDFYVYITSGTGIWGPPMRTSSDSEIVVITLE